VIRGGDAFPFCVYGALDLVRRVRGGGQGGDLFLVGRPVLEEEKAEDQRREENGKAYGVDEFFSEGGGQILGKLHCGSGKVDSTSLVLSDGSILRESFHEDERALLPEVGIRGGFPERQKNFACSRRRLGYTEEVKSFLDRMDAVSDMLMEGFTVGSIAWMTAMGALIGGAFFPSDALASPAPKIRVRVVDGVTAFNVRGFDLRLQSADRYDLRIQQSSASRSAVETRADRVSEWKLRCPKSGMVEAIQLGKAKQPLRTVHFHGPVTLESPSGFVTAEGRSYREKILVHAIPGKSGWRCDAVNHVDIESYLDGLVNAEFSASWSPAAIDAQVIAARTYAFFQMKTMAAKKGGSHFDLDSTTKDQVYDGSKREDYRSRRSANRTRGMVLKAKRSDVWPIKAYYHSTCGGKTELPEVVWGGSSRGFKRRVHCHHCKSSPSYVWDVPIAMNEIALGIWKGARSLGAADREITRHWPVSWERDLRSSRLLELKVATLNESGRAEKVTSRWRNAEGREFVLSVPGPLFRSWIGPSRLKSTVFQALAAGGDRWVLRGRGFGHGVGLCQWGAKTMGELGRSSREILKTYYPDAVIAKAW
jgi:stage II sporulation protein D